MSRIDPDRIGSSAFITLRFEFLDGFGEPDDSIIFGVLVDFGLDVGIDVLPDGIE